MIIFLSLELNLWNKEEWSLLCFSYAILNMILLSPVVAQLRYMVMVSVCQSVCPSFHSCVCNLVKIIPLKPLDGFCSNFVWLLDTTFSWSYCPTILFQQSLWELWDFDIFLCIDTIWRFCECTVSQTLGQIFFKFLTIIGYNIQLIVLIMPSFWFDKYYSSFSHISPKMLGLVKFWLGKSIQHNEIYVWSNFRFNLLGYVELLPFSTFLLFLILFFQKFLLWHYLTNRGHTVVFLIYLQDRKSVV